MLFLTARVYEHSHPLSALVFIVYVFLSLSRLTGIARSTRLRYFFHFISYFILILITCTVAFPTIGNTVVLLELLVPHG
jgi:hypothetical protein